MTTFKRIKLGDLVTWAKGCNIPRDDTSANKNIPYLHYGDLYKKYGYCLNLPEVINDIIKIDSLNSVKEPQMLHDGDIVFTLTSETVDDLGHCTLVINPDDVPFVSGMETTVLHLKESSKAMPTYLNYIFQDERFRKIMRQYVTGMKVYRVHPKDLMRIEIDLPPLDVQAKIVGILDSFSDSIINLGKINDNLSALLMAEFGRIFESADDVVPLSEIANYATLKVSSGEQSLETYYSTENILPGKQGSMLASGIPEESKVTACRKGDVLVSNIRPYFKKILYCDEDCTCSTDVLCFHPKATEYSTLVYAALFEDQFFDYVMSGAKGTKMPRGDKAQIMEYGIPAVDPETLITFNKTSSAILNAIYKNRCGNKALTQLRDYLLPKLMSGEIDVSSSELPTKYSFSSTDE